MAHECCGTRRKAHYKIVLVATIKPVFYYEVRCRRRLDPRPM